MATSNGCWHGFAIEDDLSKPVHERALWELAEQLCPVDRNHDYTQAIMDLGATVCTPKAFMPVLPNAATLQGTSAGSGK